MNNQVEDQAKWLRHIWRQEREELKTCRVLVKYWTDHADTIETGLRRHRRHRKWALIEMKDKQRLWRNYCGEVSEQMDKVEDCRAEIKCLKAILANKGINF